MEASKHRCHASNLLVPVKGGIHIPFHVLRLMQCQRYWERATADKHSINYNYMQSWLALSPSYCNGAPAIGRKQRRGRACGRRSAVPAYL